MICISECDKIYSESKLYDTASPESKTLGGMSRKICQTESSTSRLQVPHRYRVPSACESVNNNV